MSQLTNEQIVNIAQSSVDTVATNIDSVKNNFRQGVNKSLKTYKLSPMLSPPRRQSLAYVVATKRRFRR